MLTTYRRALSVPGAWQFSATGFAARLPVAMIGLGIVVYISTLTGSYATAGVLSAAFQISAALGAIVTSLTMDRLGQHRLLPWIAAVHAVALIGFVLAVESGTPVVAQILIVIVAGAAQPAIGSMVRARWANATQDVDKLRGAFALESIIDELIFSLGPIATTFLAFQVGLPVPILVSAVIALIGALVLTLQRRTEPPPARKDAHTHRGTALRIPGLALVVVGALGVGGVFGTYEVAVVAFTTEAGSSGMSGLILSLWAVGSMLSGIVFGGLHWRAPLPRQVMLLTGMLTVVLLPAPFVRSTSVLIVTSLIAGLAVAPSLIAIFSLTERIVPSPMLTEGLTFANSGLALGFSAGTALGGVTVDHLGTAWAFALPAVSAGMAFVVALLGRGLLDRAVRNRASSPVVPAVSWVDDPVPGPTSAPDEP
mgnify:CR=1 FL=1